MRQRGQKRRDALRHRLPERVVDVHEHGRLRRGLRFGEDVLEQNQAVPADLGRGREVAEHELVALLGDLRRGGDVDDVRNAMLLRHLRDRGGMPRIERADEHVRALADEALGTATRGVDVGLGVGVHDLDLDAEPLPDELGGDVGSFLAGLPISACNPERGSKRPILNFALAASAFARAGKAEAPACRPPRRKQ